MTPLAILLLSLAGVALGVFAWLLLAPIRLEVRGEGDSPAREWKFSVRGAYGLISLRARWSDSGSLTAAFLGPLRVWTAGRKTDPKTTKETSPEPDDAQDSPSLIDRIRFIDRHWGWAELLRFVLGSRRYLHLDPCEGRVEFACEDPALEGEIFGYAGTLLHFAQDEQHFELIPIWTFENEVRGWLRVGLRIYLLRLVLSIGFFLATRYRRVPRRTPRGEASAEAT